MKSGQDPSLSPKPMILDPSGTGQARAGGPRPQAAAGAPAPVFPGNLVQPGPECGPGTPDPEIRDISGPVGSKSGSTTAGTGSWFLSASSEGRPLGARVLIDDTSHYARRRASGWIARSSGRRVVAPLRGCAPRARHTGHRPRQEQPQERADRRRRVPRVRARALAAALGRDRKRPAARRHPAPAPPAGRHVQLARRSRRRDGQGAPHRPDQRGVRGARGAEAIRHHARPLSELVGPETLAYVEAADTWQGIVAGGAAARGRSGARRDVPADGDAAHQPGRPHAGARARRARHHAADAARGRARRAARAPDAVGEAGRRSASSSPASRTK